jgi:hypothetical protein
VIRLPRIRKVTDSFRSLLHVSVGRQEAAS